MVRQQIVVISTGKHASHAYETTDTLALKALVTHMRYYTQTLRIVNRHTHYTQATHIVHTHLLHTTHITECRFSVVVGIDL